MYVYPANGMIYLTPRPQVVDPILIPYSITVPFSINDITKGLNASGGLMDLGGRYVIQLIINIPE